MLQLWLDYYSRFFDPDDLYVLNHDGTEGSVDTASGRCRVIPIHRSTLVRDHRWLRSTVEAFQAFLLRSYEVVLFAEADEFVVADPRLYSGLDQYIERLDPPGGALRRLQRRSPVWRAFGSSSDRPDPGAATVLARVARLLQAPSLPIPLRWSEGFHDEYDAPEDPPDSSLLLVHLHRVDYDWCLSAIAPRRRATGMRRMPSGGWRTESDCRT